MVPTLVRLCSSHCPVQQALSKQNFTEMKWLQWDGILSSDQVELILEQELYSMMATRATAYCKYAKVLIPSFIALCELFLCHVDHTSHVPDIFRPAVSPSCIAVSVQISYVLVQIGAEGHDCRSKSRADYALTVTQTVPSSLDMRHEEAKKGYKTRVGEGDVDSTACEESLVEARRSFTRELEESARQCDVEKNSLRELRCCEMKNKTRM